MYISLGGSCATIHQIIEHVGKNETLFFDWLSSNKFYLYWIIILI